MKLFCEQMKKLPLSFKEFLPIADSGGKGLSACSNCSVTPPISWWVGGKSGNWIDFQASPPPQLLCPASLHAPSSSTLLCPVFPCPPTLFLYPVVLPLPPLASSVDQEVQTLEREGVKVFESPLLSLSVCCLQIQITMRWASLPSLPSESGWQWLPLTAGKTEFHSQSQNNKQRSNPRTPSFRQTAL